MANIRNDYCLKHDREMTGFSTLFCPACDREKEYRAFPTRLEDWPADLPKPDWIMHMQVMRDRYEKMMDRYYQRLVDDLSISLFSGDFKGDK